MPDTSFVARYGPWALVAGASEGLGEAFARALAARGLNLVLLSRRAEVLEPLGRRLAEEHGVKARPVALDLAAPELPARLEALADELEIGLAVYNAAHALIGPFLEQPLADKLRIVDVNCRGPLVTADVLGRRMAARGRGGLILMASMAGAQGTPLVATYGATKAFDQVLAEGLWEELRATGIDVLACRPGATRTPAWERSRPAGRVPLQEPDAVVAEALAALGRGPGVVTGLANRVSAFLLGRLLPRRSAIAIMGRATRRLYPRGER